MTKEAKAPTQIVARNIRAEMARDERKQASLAAALRLSQASVSDRLTGKTPIDVNELTTIAAWLGVPIDSLLRGVPSVGVLVGAAS